mmetsp:Transcript_28593/g.94988  ORF Transcript_28593/g.94988 Transcript_28593/m.94988 type:complete len:224 (+) Transcript_28593:52-723(+)
MSLRLLTAARTCGRAKVRTTAVLGCDDQGVHRLLPPVAPSKQRHVWRRYVMHGRPSKEALHLCRREAPERVSACAIKLGAVLAAPEEDARARRQQRDELLRVSRPPPALRGCARHILVEHSLKRTGVVRPKSAIGNVVADIKGDPVRLPRLPEGQRRCEVRDLVCLHVPRRTVLRGRDVVKLDSQVEERGQQPIVLVSGNSGDDLAATHRDHVLQEQCHLRIA